MRRVTAQMSIPSGERIHRLVAFDDIAREWSPDLRLLALTSSKIEQAGIETLAAAGVPVGWIASTELEIGDVITCQPLQGRCVVLFRESEVHHSLLTTNRCNSYCLMCSQPPTRQADEWLVDEALEVIRHIRVSPRVLGLSGGEPTLLGARLRTMTEAIRIRHPATTIEILTNARLLGDAATAEALLANASNTRWLVPLYGHADFLHDFVVQSPGAFDQTIAGLLALQEHKQPVQLRIVLIKPVLEVLADLCQFIGRNLPFVREVALMACEPIGFALANREQCEVDLVDWSETLTHAAGILRCHGVPFLFMNAPLCSLPQALWPAAHKSISDWKNVYAPECDACSLKSQCSGLFAWHESGWKPAKINPIKREECV